MNIEHTCSRCGKENLKKITMARQKVYCNPCYYSTFCQFCDHPIENELCPGHSAVLAKNRFKDDPSFVMGAQFDFESQGR